MNTTSSDTELHEPPSRPLNKKLIASLIALVLVVAVYVGGYFHGRSELKAQKTDYEQRVGVIQDKLSGTEKQLVQETARNHLLLARNLLYSTSMDLEERNFGTANTRLQEAAAALAKVGSGSGNFDREKVAQLSTAASQMNINVATDLEQQRGQVLGFAAQLDELMSTNP
ncbi:MAG: hypothetical protein LH491_07785 [Pseudoxanthomonas sp.]|nr:hypothetical protein [Pseudoxanthomonas sp.]